MRSTAHRIAIWRKVDSPAMIASTDAAEPVMSALRCAIEDFRGRAPDSEPFGPLFGRTDIARRIDRQPTLIARRAPRPPAPDSGLP